MRNCDAHPNEDFDPIEFERIYRREHNLNDAPIPYAVVWTDGDSESGNGAVSTVKNGHVDGSLALKQVCRLSVDDNQYMKSERMSLA